MAKYSGAQWRGPVPNQMTGGMSAHYGLVLHIMEGTLEGTDAWVHNPTSQVSAHFGNPKTGGLVQWVDTDDRAWAEANGNPYWVSVENEGNSGDSLTASQVENAAHLLAWLHGVHGVPLQVTDSVNTGGLAYHALGGIAWGDHPDCPGAPIIAQRSTIVARALELTGNTPPPLPISVPVVALQALLNSVGANLATDGIKGPLTKAAFLHYIDAQPMLSIGANGANVRILQAMLNTWGARIAADGDFGPLTDGAVRTFQHVPPVTLTVDGIAGPLTKAKLAS